MISTNRSLINPVIVNGTINRSQIITDMELFDLVWILNHFDEGSEWWILGRSLIFEAFNLWNRLSYLNQSLSFQLLALRTLVAYSPGEILLNASSTDIYRNLSKLLWVNVSAAINNVTGTFNPSNDTLLNTESQIFLSQILANSVNHPTIFNITNTRNMATLFLDTIDTITYPTDGIPDSFNSTLTFGSDIFYSHHQSEMVLALEELLTLLGSIPVVSTITNRLNNFLTNVFLLPDWSVANRYNITTSDLSPKIELNDQVFFARSNIMQNKRSLADYTLTMVRQTFRTINSSYYTSTSDHEYQFLTEHVHLLLSFEEFLKLEKPTSATSIENTTTDETGAMAGYGWESVIIIISLVFIIYRRRVYKR
ncbi:MAG: hypothetical protein ACW98F_16855 [Candidatus Hodarchaeales archaeon]